MGNNKREIDNQYNSPTVFERVFGQDLLRELILGSAILSYKDNHVLRQRDLKSFRLVGKGWRSITTKILCKNRIPLYSLKIRSLVPLHQFAVFFSGRKETFALTLAEDFFLRKNYDEFIRILQNCASGLVELHLLLPKSSGSFPGIIPPIGLSSLRNFSATLSSASLEMETLDDNNNKSNTTTFLIISLLNQSHNLVEGAISLNPENDKNVFLPGIEFATLPTSLTKLDLQFRITEKELDLLIRVELPHLKELILEMEIDWVKYKGFTRILKKFSATLRYLELLGENWVNDRATAINEVINEVHMEFPVMQKLEQLKTVCLNVFLAKKNADNFSTYFPELTSLELNMITERSMGSWANSSGLPTLEKFTIQVMEYILETGHVKNIPNPQLLGKCLSVMPNVSELTLYVAGHRDVPNLIPLFAEMGDKISSLKLCVISAEGINNSDIWDSALTGLSRKITSGIRQLPGFWNSFKIRATGCDNSAIRVMKNLKTLTLQDIANGERSPFISKLAFTCAFNKMLGLTDLTLTGRFQVSPDIVHEWERTGKKIRLMNKDLD